MSTKCLICYCNYHHLSNQYDSGGVKIEEVNTVNDFTSKKSVLSKHLDVIFILRNIFEVPVSQLSNYLKNCPKVDNWICICVKCQDIVSGYRNIYEDLLEISRKFQEAKLGIIKIVKKSYSDGGKGDDDLVPDITDECRRFINKYEYRNFHNPFKDGDLKALELAKSVNHGNWHWASDHDESIGPGPDSPADVEDDDHDHWNSDDDGDSMDADSEDQMENETQTPKKGHGRPPGKGKQKRSDELMEEWKPGYKPKPKWKPKKKKRKPIQRQLKYPCPHSPDCSLQFSSKTVLDSHLKTDHGLIKKHGAPKKYPLECYVDTGNGKYRYRLKIPSKCESCNKWFKTQDCLRTHIKFTHENRFPYYCKRCGIGRTSKGNLEKHEALCSSKPEVTLSETQSCPEEGCTMVVSRATGLEIHFREKHPEREPFSVCPHCEQKLYTKMGYARHLKSEHQISKPFKCEYCGQEFKKQSILDQHKKIARRCKLLYLSETEATIICDICGGNYSTQYSLQSHIKAQHENQFDFRCEHCDKGFQVEDYLNVHLFKRHKIGDGSNLKYKCKVEGCSRIFFQSKPLRCHMAMHEGKTPGFTCDECGKQFYERHGLTQHKRLKHTNVSKEVKFKCEVCGAEFGIIEYLKRHKRTVHKIFPEKRRQDL